MNIYRKQMGALVFGQLFSLVLSFLVPMILAHILSNNDFGLYAQFNIITGFCMSFFSFGISSELYFFYPNSGQKKKRTVVFQSFGLLIVVGLIAFLLFLIPSFRNLFVGNDFLEQNYFYLLLAIFFSIPTVILFNLYVVKHDNKTSALFLPASTILRLGLIFVFYWYDPGIKSIFLAILFNYFLIFLFVAFYVFQEIKTHDRGSLFNFQVLKDQLAYVIPLGIGNSARTFAQQVDKLILLTYVTPAKYAIYSIAFYGVPGLTQLYLSISQSYVPRMSVAFAQSNMQLVKDLYKSLVLKTLSYTIPIVFIICLFSPVIVPFLFSEKYVQSVPYFQLFLFTFIFSAMGNGLVLRASGQTKRSLKAYTYSLIFVIPITYFGIRYYQLNGAIVSAFIGSVLPRFLLTKYDITVMKCNMTDIFPLKEIGKIILISVLMIIPFFIIKYFFSINILVAALCITVYIFCVFAAETYFNLFIISKKEMCNYRNRALITLRLRQVP